MENFIVSARKYRPKTFDDVVGQQSLANTLKRAIVNHKLASAYLFCGPRGVGKTTCARIFAQAINCLHPHENGEACNECESCVSFNEQRSLNIQELNAAANNSVEDIRQIIEQVRIPPQLGKYKVIILDEVHMLSAAASNALLKTLEEPPTYVVFILATTEKQKILPTILSRCQIFDFNRMEIDDILGELKMVAEKEGIQYEDRALNIIAGKADGGMRDALSIFDQATNFSSGNITYESVLKCLNVLDYDYYFKITDVLLRHEVGEALLIFNEIVNKGFNGGVFMGGLAAHLRDLLVSKDAKTVDLLDVARNVKDQYAQQAAKCSAKFLYRAIRMCDRCSNEYKTSYNKRLSVEITLIEVAQLDDSDASGPGPAQVIKPLFQDTNNVAQQVSNKVRTTSVAAGNTVPQPAAPAPQPAYAPPQPAAPAPQPTYAAPQPSAAAPTNASTEEKPRPKTRLVIHSTPSIRNQNNSQPQTVKTEPVHVQAVQPPVGDKPITITAVNYFWKQFMDELPQEEKALSGRMEGMELELANGTKLIVKVNNEMVREFFRPFIPKLQNYLRKKLENSHLEISTTVAVTEHQVLRYNPRELFSKIVKDNKGFSKMKDLLGLDVDV